jgi:ElaB/YqjD/DUF883 family membrane-anchored ribosome-binding protein
MHFRTTSTTTKLLEDFNRLSAEIEPRLDQVSAAARAEWRDLRSRLPTVHDLQNGFSPVSDQDLAVMHAKVLRFREFLGVRRAAPARVGVPVIVVSPVARG